MTPKFTVRIEQGKMGFEDRESFNKYLYSLMGIYELIIRKPKKSRSGQQNKYYWGVVIPLASDYFGYDHNEMHEAFKFLFLRKEEQGKPLTVGSTAKLTTKEFVEYIDKIIIWLATEHGVLTPAPNQVEI
jgi:hypothetical protein